MNGGPITDGVTWASAKARSEEVNGYPSFSTRNNGFFSRHARKISSSLPRFNLGNRQTYAEKEKLGRGRWYPNAGSRMPRIRTFLGSFTRRMRLRILVVFAIILAVILFYVTRESFDPYISEQTLISSSYTSRLSEGIVAGGR